MENESLGALEIEFIINNPQILAELEVTEANFAATTNNIQAQAAKAAAAIEKLIAKGGFSDSQAEVDAYTASLRGLGDTGQVALSGTDELMRVLNADLEAGVITAEEFRASVDHIAEAQARFAAQAEQANAAEAVQLGLLERLQAEMAALQKVKPTLLNANEIEAANIQIAAYAEEIKRLNGLGVTGGNATAAAVEKPVGAYNRLKYAAQLYEEQARTSLNPDIIAKYNAKLQQAEAELARLKNVGKQGFDEMGNALPVERVGAFERALGRATNVSAIAGRVVTQLSRQIIGLGVGMLSFAVGAKAIEYIIGLIANLDIFTGRLDQAKHNLEAFNEVNANAAKTAGAEVANLQILYRAANDVNNSMANRLKYAQQIKDTYPQSFANSSAQAILNGQEADSYKKLAEQIIAQAKAKAVADKIAANSAVIINAQIQQSKIRIANVNEISNAQKLPSTITSRNTDAILTPRQDAIDASNERAKESLKAQQDTIDQAKNMNQFLIDFAGGIGAVANTVNQNLKLIDEPLKNFDSILKNASNKAGLENLKASLQAKLDGLAPNNKQIAEYQDKIRQVEEIEKKYSPKTTDGNADLESAKAKARLMQQITDIESAYNRKALSKDDEQIQAIKDKFNKLRADVVAFNNDPKNKHNQFTDNSRINNDEANAIAIAKGEQSIEPLKREIAAKKALYNDYEDYKLKAGSEYADKLYSKEIGSYKSYMDYLSGLMPNEAQLTTGTIEDKAAAVALKDYIVKAEAEANSQEGQRLAKHLQALVLENLSYETKRKQLIESANSDIAELNKNNQTAEADEVSNNLNKKLAALEEAHFKEQDSYKNLFDNIDKLTAAAARKQLDALYQQQAAALATGQITREAYDANIKLLKSAGDKIDSRLPLSLKEVSKLLGGLATDISPFDAELGKVIGSMGNVVGGIASIKDNLKTIQDSSSGTFEKFSSGLGIIGTAFGLVSGIFSLFDHSAEEQKELQEKQKYAQDLALKANQAVTAELDRQLAIIKDIYGTARVTAYGASIADIQKTQADQQAKLSGKYTLTGDKQTDDYISALNAGDKTGGLAFQAQGAFQQILDKLKQAGAVFDASTLSLDQLQKMLDNGKLSADTASVVESLITLQKQYTDTVNALHAETIGEAFDDVVNSIVDLFQNATTSTQDFADNFEKIIQKSILNTFKRQFLETQLQGFYDDFAKFTADNSGGGLDASEIQKLQDEYNAAIINAQKGFTDLEKATGVSFAATNQQNTLAGQIKGITADDASILAGVFRAVQLSVVQSNSYLQQNGTVMQAQLAEMKAQTLLQKLIEVNTRRTADAIDNDVTPALNKIANNTASSAGLDARAAGYWKY